MMNRHQTYAITDPTNHRRGRLQLSDREAAMLNRMLGFLHAEPEFMKPTEPHVLSQRRGGEVLAGPVEISKVEATRRNGELRKAGAKERWRAARDGDRAIGDRPVSQLAFGR